MLTVEAMTGRAERFFQGDTQFPKERYPIVTVKGGKVLGGFLYYKDQMTGVWGVFLKRAEANWLTADVFAELVEFPFTTLGADTVITTFNGSDVIKSLCAKAGAVFPEARKAIWTRENALKAIRVLRGEELV